MSGEYLLKSMELERSESKAKHRAASWKMIADILKSSWGIIVLLVSAVPLIFNWYNKLKYAN